jgi:SWI/SNF-related matrix-associated actin-dependent regulator of chromatin subfamily A3
MADAVVTGEGNGYDIPVDIGMYGTSNPARKRQLRDRLVNDGLKCDEFDRRNSEAERARLGDLQRATRNIITISDDDDDDHSQMRFLVTGNHTIPSRFHQTMDDIIANSELFDPRQVQQYAEKYGMSQDDLAKLPKATQPKRIATQMLPYQLQGLAWMISKENPQLPPPRSQEIVQLWKRDGKSPNMFQNIATNFTIKDEEPKLASGGILADDMGLGKTLQVISLIVSDLENVKPNEPKTTLIASPVGVMSNWTDQIKQHVNPKKPLRVFVYHGVNKKKVSKARDFDDYDVIITSYATIAGDYAGDGIEEQGTRQNGFGIFSNHWRRVVLDEGHQIRNPRTKISLSAKAISARSRWCLTGTPIVNSLTDLCSVLRFIGISGGLEQVPVFNSVLTRPIKNRSEQAIALLQAIMASFTLRRKKHFKFIDIKLPEKKEYRHLISFGKRERKMHDALSGTARQHFDDYLAQRRGNREDRRKAQDTYRHLFEVVLRLRQVCNDWRLCRTRVLDLMEALKKSEVVSLTPENVKALQDMLSLIIENVDACPICLEDMTIGRDPVITHCGHTFCRDDITMTIQAQGKCPLCRAPLNVNQLVEPAVPDTEDTSLEDLDTEDEEADSSKVKALLSILETIHDQPNPKIVIFSQWTSFLSLLEPHLVRANFKYTRLDGTMSTTKRDTETEKFKEDPEITILLASLAVCSVGINLTVANTAILCDSWWAPAIEDQAIDRIHRLGQKRDCTVWRLVIEDSIEQRVLSIQEDKRELMRAAFNDKIEDSARNHEARVQDIRRLLAY